MKTFKLNLTENPSFNTVINLTNKTFDPDNFVSGRGATEDQLKILNDYIADVEANCCSVMGDDLYNVLVQRLDDLENLINNFCECNTAGGDAPAGTCNDADITVTMSWDANPIANGGQMSAVSSSGAGISMYYFLVQGADGIFVRTGSVNFAGQQISVNGSTGKLSLVGNGGGTGGKIFAAARDANGCEGIGQFSVTTAPWYVAG